MLMMLALLARSILVVASEIVGEKLGFKSDKSMTDDLRLLMFS
jgi:hypothetical protein